MNRDEDKRTGLDRKISQPQGKHRHRALRGLNAADGPAISVGRMTGRSDPGIAWAGQVRDASTDSHRLGDMLDRLRKLASKADTVSLGDVVEALGNRSYGPFLILLPLIDISPVGAVPGLPTLLAVLIILVAGQLLLGRKHLWLPGFVQRRSISAGRVAKAIEKIRPFAKRMDRWFHGRMPMLTSGPFVRVAAGAIILMALTVPPLELLPLATTAPMGAIAAFGLALLVRDGLLMVAAILLAVAAVAVGLSLI
ncbi:exopolysaccharide biosynthesis protein [Sphingobium sp. HDIP04]|uniref:exopolysaccharide biosynthesis protein n=1 Tax=Sphingobium sp. HDIP04 TaxID=428994 RepID=UPI001EE75CE6|nr:exopolysaccharide biosynthesis protein [Sphingobium sp. HDIP04]